MTTTSTPTLAPAAASRHQVRKATERDVPRLARAMALAFYDDPVVGAWCFPDERLRMRRLERSFDVLLRRVYLAHDACYTIDARAGGALWLPPGAWKLGVREQLRVTARLARAQGRALPRTLRVLAFVESRHPHEPHHYLAFVGVEPASQGRGLGSELLRPVLDRCDGERRPAYLEASSERNRALYERHGFEPTDELRLPGGGPPIWPMWRDAQ